MPVIGKQSAGSHIAIIIVFLSLLLGSGLAQAASISASVKQQLLEAANRDKQGEYTFKHCQPIRHEDFDMSSPKRKILLIGDSQGCDLLNGIRENGYFRNDQIRMLFIPYECQPVIGNSTILPRYHRFCEDKRRADTLVDSQKQISQADIIIFSSRWKLKAARSLPHTLRYLNLRSDQRVLVVGSKNFGKVNIRRYLSMSPQALKQKRNKVDEKVQKINDVLRKGLAGQAAIFIDQQRLICGADDSCPVFTSNLNLISYDGRHLTREGARYSGRVLFSQSPLGNL